MRRILSVLVFFALLYNGQSNAADTKPVSITATSWLVSDGSGKILQEENIDQIRSIASISKLVTVMVVMDANQDLDEPLKPYTRRELIQLALVKSDNKAAIDLCTFYPGGRDACVYAMNTKMRALGLNNTKFVEPTGLSVFNISTARELITLVKTAQTYPVIVEAAKTSEVKIKLK